MQQSKHWSGGSQQMVLRDSGQNVEDSSGGSDKEPSDVTVCVTDRQWTDCRKQQWTQ